MKKQQSFVPSAYIKAVKKGRKQLFRKSLIGVSGMAMLFIGIMSTSGYADYFVAQSAAAKGYEAAREAVLPSFKSYRLEPVPDPREQLNGDIVESVDETPAEEAPTEDSYYEAYTDYSFGDYGCNVLGLTVSGDIGTDYGYTSANYIRDTLDYYKGDESIKAILVEVDSGGGSPVAGDEIKTMLEEQTVPVIAQVRELAASAAYLSILSADRIFAHRYGSIGSIGVIIPYYDYTEYNHKEGIKYDPIKTGEYKDIANGERPLTKEERQILQEEIDFVYEGFIADVAKYRGMSVEKVRELADGKTWLAAKAMEEGLIDEVGGRPEVTAHLRETIGEEPVVCWQ